MDKPGLPSVVKQEPCGCVTEADSTALHELQDFLQHIQAEVIRVRTAFNDLPISAPILKQCRSYVMKWNIVKAVAMLELVAKSLISKKTPDTSLEVAKKKELHPDEYKFCDLVILGGDTRTTRKGRRTRRTSRSVQSTPDSVEKVLDPLDCTNNLVAATADYGVEEMDESVVVELEIMTEPVGENNELHDVQFPEAFPSTFEPFTPLETISEPQSIQDMKTSNATARKRNSGAREENLYACKECSERFCHYSKLQRHLAIHKGNLAYGCPICPLRLETMALLKTHKREAHCKDKQWVCSNCHKVFAKFRFLAVHMRSHTGAKPYVCPDCGMAFGYSSTLTTHRRIHSGEKPYTCQDCGRSFAQPSALTTHRRMHSGEKPFKCRYCSIRFSQTGHRSQHEKIHTLEKDYVCHVCGKNFNSSYNLSTHVRTHTGEKPFHCQICNKSFRSKTHLNRHQKVHKKKAEIIETGKNQEMSVKHIIECISTKNVIKNKQTLIPTVPKEEVCLVAEKVVSSNWSEHANQNLMTAAPEMALDEPTPLNAHYFTEVQ